MKALQKNQGRTDQMLGAMADVLTSVAMPNQQWVSWSSVFFFVCVLLAVKTPQILNCSSRRTRRCFPGLAGHDVLPATGSRHHMPSIFHPIRVSLS